MRLESFMDPSGLVIQSITIWTLHKTYHASLAIGG